MNASQSGENSDNRQQTSQSATADITSADTQLKSVTAILDNIKLDIGSLQPATPFEIGTRDILTRLVEQLKKITRGSGNNVQDISIYT